MENDFNDSKISLGNIITILGNTNVTITGFSAQDSGDTAFVLAPNSMATLVRLSLMNNRGKTGAAVFVGNGAKLNLRDW